MVRDGGGGEDRGSFLTSQQVELAPDKQQDLANGVGS